MAGRLLLLAAALTLPAFAGCVAPAADPLAEGALPDAAPPLRFGAAVPMPQTTGSWRKGG